MDEERRKALIGWHGGAYPSSQGVILTFDSTAVEPRRFGQKGMIGFSGP